MGLSFYKLWHVYNSPPTSHKHGLRWNYGRLLVSLMQPLCIFKNLPKWRMNFINTSSKMFMEVVQLFPKVPHWRPPWTFSSKDFDEDQFDNYVHLRLSLTCYVFNLYSYIFVMCLRNLTKFFKHNVSILEYFGVK